MLKRRESEETAFFAKRLQELDDEFNSNDAAGANQLATAAEAMTSQALREKMTAKNDGIKKARKLHDQKMKRFQESQQVYAQPYHPPVSSRPCRCHCTLPAVSSRPRQKIFRGGHKNLRRKFKF